MPKRHTILGGSMAASLLMGLLATGPVPADARGRSHQPTTPRFEFVGRYSTGAGGGSAEIAAVSGDVMYLTSGAVIDVVDIADPSSPVKTGALDLSADGGEPTSVAADKNVVVVAVPGSPRTNPGKVVIFENGARVAEASVGALPDSVAIDGNWVVVANEGEPNSYGQPDSVDPEGSISIIDLRRLRNGRPDAVRTLGFTDFNVGGPRAAEAAGLRITSPVASRAQDIEPEYVTIHNGTAYVTLQENNAVALVDIGRARITALVPLGVKDHRVAGNELDASDRDRAVAITAEPVVGLYMPDGIAAYRSRGATYLVTANEGDARDYPGFVDEARVRTSAVVLDPTAYPNAATLKQDAELGRLTVSRVDGDTDGDGDIDQLHAYGARSVSIWSDAGALVWDSGSLLERITAEAAPGAFNASNDNNTFDDRSDNKGPEPEGVTVGRAGGRDLAFVGLERIGGVVVLDVTDPASPRYLQYLNTRTFAAGAVGPDLGPEGLVYLPANASPTGSGLLVVANEVSGTVAFFGEAPRRTPDRDGAGRLTLLHNNDGESSLLPLTNPGSLPVGGVAAFGAVVQRETADARNLNNAVLNVYAGDAFLASSTLACSLPPNPPGTPIYDAIAQRIIGYDVQALGNHEFDFGPDFLEQFIRQHSVDGRLTTPFLGANLDFTSEPGFRDLLDRDGLVDDGQRTRVIGGAAIVVDDVTGQRFGVVSAITPALATISSPRNVVVTTRDIAETAAVLQDEIDRLEARGVRKIILVSHLQNLANDRLLVRELEGVDIAVAGGGDEQLQSPNIPDNRELLPGDPAAVETYPVYEDDRSGRSVPIVTTSGNYKYVGRIDVSFDAAGELSSIDLNRTYPRRVLPVSTAAAGLSVFDTVTPDATLLSQVVEPVTACLATNATPIASTEVRINVSRSGNASLGFGNGVRSGETNGGNLVADSFLASYDRYAAANGLPARSATNPVIAVQNGGGIRQNAGDVLPVGGVTPGSITRDNTLNVLAFLTNTVTVVSDITPAQLKSILERSASSPGGGQFLQIGGFTVTYDLSETAQVVSAPPPGATFGTVTVPGSRVVDVVLDDGTVIVQGGVVQAGAPNVRIVTNSFTAAGGDNYPDFGASTVKANLPLTYEQALVEFLRDFPVGSSGLPTIPASDTRYTAADGAGRITFVGP
jgi:2',3'-cyclic-nucleotide 2'-phosphodiesterase (5'-nucleotidase family)